MKEYQGNLNGTKLKFALIVSRFNEFVTKRLLEGALSYLQRQDVKKEDCDIYWVPGSFEIPLIALKAAKTGRYDAVICLGTVIKGETPHFDYVAGEAAKGISHVSLQTETPVIFGIITADSLEQAIQRAGAKDGNKGSQAAEFAIEMANLLKQIK